MVVKEVAILGAGPSGMMAAHAVSQNGFRPIIFDRDPDKTRRNSGIYYLHSNCGLALESTTMQQRVLGAENLNNEEFIEAYRAKVYGDRQVSSKSIIEARFEDEVEIFNASEALNHLWDMYGGQVHTIFAIENIEDVEGLHEKYPHMISTIPASVLFPDITYDFKWAYIDAGEAPEEDCFVYYNVGSAIPWYRCSAVFGAFAAEYAFEVETERPLKKVTKVIGKSQDLPYYDWLICTGRYGAWDKGFLTDTVYWHVQQELHKRGWL